MCRFLLKKYHLDSLDFNEILYLATRHVTLSYTQMFFKSYEYDIVNDILLDE